MTTPPTTILWFRQDLRLTDNAALIAALQRGGPVLPVYIDSSAEESPWAAGAASRWWLHQSLTALDRKLRRLDTQLLVRRGSAQQTLDELLDVSGATAVYWNRRYEPAVIARDQLVKAALRKRGIAAESFNSALLVEPWQVQNQAGKPFQVFTPFWRHVVKSLDPPSVLAAPQHWPNANIAGAFQKVTAAVGQLTLNDLSLLPQINWYQSMANTWTPGEQGAAEQLEIFLDAAVLQYDTGRDRPAVRGTSQLSPHLHFGEISPRQIWHALAQRAVASTPDAAQRMGWRGSQYVTELGWREFAHHLLFHFPHTPLEPLRTEFTRFPWAQDAAALRAWQQGRTGVPLIDAGLRELWATGWMHNRVRMIVASFLVKNLRLPWQDGARWFWDTLVDADLASNTMGWQWSAGCGADAAPYFRIFNPVTQGKRFDPDGSYVRRWVPELAALGPKHVHAPWEAPPQELSAARVQLGISYPLPMVDLQISRAAALKAFQTLRAS